MGLGIPMPSGLIATRLEKGSAFALFRISTVAVWKVVGNESDESLS